MLTTKTTKYAVKIKKRGFEIRSKERFSLAGICFMSYPLTTYFGLVFGLILFSRRHVVFHGFWQNTNLLLKKVLKVYALGSWVFGTMVIGRKTLFRISS